MATLRKHRSETGTTLLEVMVAMAVASLALVSFITLVVSSMDLEEVARNITNATIAADEKLNEVESNGFPEVGKTEGLLEGKDPPNSSYNVVVSETPIQNVRQIDVEVFWDNKRRSVMMSDWIVKQ
jgi:general secretion pathway protein I